MTTLVNKQSLKLLQLRFLTYKMAEILLVLQLLTCLLTGTSEYCALRKFNMDFPNHEDCDPRHCDELETYIDQFEDTHTENGRPKVKVKGRNNSI